MGGLIRDGVGGENYGMGWWGGNIIRDRGKTYKGGGNVRYAVKATCKGRGWGGNL